MSPKQLTHLSKFLSLVLRHEPDLLGLSLDEAGWTSVLDLLAACARHNHPLTRDQLIEIVATSEKKRFALTPDQTQIRANQGHSIPVALGYPPAIPPDLLYHGTHNDALPSILAQGLHRGVRHHVHLSESPATATSVGQRRGHPIVLTIRARSMHTAGHLFHLSENNVWLTDHVPPQFIQSPSTPNPQPQ